MFKEARPPVTVQNLTMAYGDRVIQRDLSFTVNEGEVFIVMGGNGCGKSTLMKHMIGLFQPATGRISYNNVSLWDVDASERQALMSSLGVLYQSSALWSSLTLAENVALVLQSETGLSLADISEMVSLKLSLVGLGNFEDYYPSEISGGMKKRAALARALALDPAILFFDEPSAGLDPPSAKILDDLILELRDSLGTTIVVVTHELNSILAVGDNSVFLDIDTKTMIAGGHPRDLLAHCTNKTVREFLTRGQADGPGGGDETCFFPPFDNAKGVGS